MKHLLPQIDRLRRTLAMQTGYYIPRTGAPVKLTSAAFSDTVAALVLALCALFDAIRGNAGADEIKRITANANAEWRIVPLPKEQNRQWLSIRNEVNRYRQRQ